MIYSSITFLAPNFGHSPSPLGLGGQCWEPQMLSFLPLAPQQPTPLPSATVTSHIRLNPNGELALYCKATHFCVRLIYANYANQVLVA